MFGVRTGQRTNMAQFAGEVSAHGGPEPLRAGSASDISRPIKILVIVPHLEIGGAETDLVRNLPLLKPGRFTPIVYTLFGGGALAATLQDHGIKVVVPDQHAQPDQSRWFFRAIDRSCRVAARFIPHAVGGRILASVSYYIGLAQPLARYLDDAEIDVIHAILPSSYLTAVIANMMARRKRPLLMSRLSLNWYHQEQRLFAVIERLFLHRRVDLVITNSQAAWSELRREGVPARKLCLIHNGIDATCFAEELCDGQDARSTLGIASNAVVFSAVGNLFPYKGHADLLNALGLIKDQLPAPWLLLIAGLDVGGHGEELRSLAAKLGIAENVRLLGQRRDVPTILSAADIHVSASHHEGFPNNVLEAMCAGLPVVATSVGGVPEQVITGVTGLLVPAKDPAELSKALLTLAQNARLRTAMGAQGRRRVQHEFPIAKSVEGLEKAYAACAGPHAP